MDGLKEKEIKWLRSRMAEEAAMSRIGKKLRSWITFLVLFVGAFLLFWDNFKALVKQATTP